MMGARFCLLLLFAILVAPAVATAQSDSDGHSTPLMVRGQVFPTNIRPPKKPLSFEKDSFSIPENFGGTDAIGRLDPMENICQEIWGPQQVELKVHRAQTDFEKFKRELESENLRNESVVKVNAREIATLQQTVDQHNKNQTVAKDILANRKRIEEERKKNLPLLRAAYEKKNELSDHEHSEDYHRKALAKMDRYEAMLRRGEKPPDVGYQYMDMIQTMRQHHKQKIGALPPYKTQLAAARSEYKTLRKQSDQLYQDLLDNKEAELDALETVGGVRHYTYNEKKGRIVDPTETGIKFTYELKAKYEKTALKAQESIAMNNEKISLAQKSLENKIKEIRSAPVPRPPNIVIAFEGTGVWAPRSFKTLHHNRHRFEGAYSKETSELLRQQINFNHKVLDDVDAPGLLSGHLFNVFEGGASSDNDFPLRHRQIMAKRDGFKETEIFYFSESAGDKMDQKALECLKKVYAPYIDSNGQKQWPSLTVIGFSSGAKRAVDFSKMLDGADDSDFTHGKKPNVDLMLNIDGVERASQAGLRGVGDWFSNTDQIQPKVRAWHNSPHFGVFSNVKKSYSFIQDTDTKGVGGIIALRGSPIANPNNDPNHQYEYVTLPADQQHAGHYYITQSPYVGSKIIDAYNKVYKSAKTSE